MQCREYHRCKHQDQGTPAACRLGIHSKHIAGIVQDSLPDTADDPTGQKRFSHLCPQIVGGSHRFDILFVFLLLLYIRLCRIPGHMRGLFLHLLLIALFCVFLFHRCTMPFRRPAACTAGRLCDCSL